jgi:hypothetical protein
MGFGDITIDVTMVVTIQPHGTEGSAIRQGNATCGQGRAYDRARHWLIVFPLVSPYKVKASGQTEPEGGPKVGGS